MSKLRYYRIAQSKQLAKTNLKANNPTVRIVELNSNYHYELLGKISRSKFIEPHVWDNMCQSSNLNKRLKPTKANLKASSWPLS